MLMKWLAGAVSLYIVSYVVEGIYIHGFTGALWASAILGLMNVFIKPILSFFALPVTILTLGLFTFVINGMVLLLASFLSSSLYVSGFIPAVIGALLLSVMNTILLKILDKKK